MARPRKICEGDDYSPLATVRRMFGQEVADQFQDRFAGLVVFIPKVPEPEHPVAKCLGHDRACQLGEECGGLQYFVSVGEARERMIERLGAQGLSEPEIARAVFLTVRGVQFIKKRLRDRDKAQAEKAYALASGGAVDV